MITSAVVVLTAVVIGVSLAGVHIRLGVLLMYFAGVIVPGGAMLLALMQSMPAADSLGGVIAIVGSIGTASVYVGRKLTRIQNVLTIQGVEHEMLIHDYCERHNMKVDDLPTRAAQARAMNRSAGSIL